MARSRPGEEERSREPRAIGEVIRSTNPIRNGLRLGRLVRAWETVAGSLAGVTEPVTLTERGLVVRASSGAWAAQVRFLAAEIRQRANEQLGGRGVSAIHVVVGRLEGRSGSGGDGPG